MSFRSRLGLFFLLMVAIPIAAIAVLVSDVTGDSQAGKADASVSTGLAAAITLYEEQTAAAADEGADLLRSDSFAAALGDPERLEQVAREVSRERGLEYLTITTRDGNEITSIQSSGPFATAVANDPTGEVRIETSVTDVTSYVRRIEELTGLRASVLPADGARVTLGAMQTGDLPDAGATADSEIDGYEVRAATAALGDEGASVTVLAPMESGGFFDSRSRIVILVALFLTIALSGVAVVARTMQSQIAAMLSAARRIGSGDFSRRVPVVGGDAMAGLASEFNKMTDQLEDQIGELRRQRTELDRSVQRLGEAFASGLDRDALLAIVAETALGACAAEYVRVSLDDGQVIEVPDGFKGPARDAAVAGQKRGDLEGEKIHVRRGEGFALAAPLRSLSEGMNVGTLSIGRKGEAFSESDREVFLYLIGQASASIENISVHERASEQAVTDELTGLPNRRAFRETINREASRAKRFGHELSLIIIDIDNFKSVNDIFGHLQGDEVLRLIGKIILEEARAIDEPARYGGEEFVVALPETGTEGAVELAERIRERLEAEEMPLLGGSGPLRVTASFGTATVPLSAATWRQLFEAADNALYEAKRTGKNRVVTAPGKVGATS